MKKLVSGRTIAAPNLINICVNQNRDGDISGKVYCRYQEEGWNFKNIVELLQGMEQFYDRISFPQAAVRLRDFAQKETEAGIGKESEEKLLDGGYVIEKCGTCATFLVNVQHRQHATWQGTVLWKEGKQKETFRSALELLMLIDNSLRLGSME